MLQTGDRNQGESPMESRTIHVVATGDGYIVRRQLTEKSVGYYRREDSTHPVATEDEVAAHLAWLTATEPRRVPRSRAYAPRPVSDLEPRVSGLAGGSP